MRSRRAWSGLAAAVALAVVLALASSSSARDTPARASGKASPDCNCFNYFGIRPDGTHRVQLSESVGDLVDISVDGTRIAYQHYVGVLTVSPIPHPAPKEIVGTPSNRLPLGPARLSRDGRQVAYMERQSTDECTQTYAIHVIGFDGANDRTVVPGCARQLAWSPDGRKLAYVRVPKTRKASQLVVVDLQTGAEGVLVSRPRPIQGIAWSPTGERIAYWDGWNGVGQLRVIRADGTHDIAISRGYYPTWSPDGRRIAYYWYRPQAYPPERLTPRLAIISRDGTHNHLFGPPTASNPAWSPDGRKLAYSANEHDTASLFTANADGSHRFRVYEGAEREGFGPLRWGRSGIVYTSEVDFGSD